MLRLGPLLAAACIALAPVPARAADLGWEQWKAIPGALDVDGTRSDGSLIVAGSAALYLVDPQGTVTDFARGPGGYHEDKGVEAYLAMSPGNHVSAAGCDFARDDTFLLRMHVPLGVNRVSAAGDESGPFTNLTGVSALTGIAFDTVGDFDHRLLVMGVSGSRTTVFAVDCNGDAQVITSTSPVLEGGIAVAPRTFGSFGGDLIVPDEVSGRIYAFKPDGTRLVVLNPPLPAGVDVTLGGLGFVPAGFMSRGGAVYHADHKTAGSSFPGNDVVLRLTSAQLQGAGVQDGDLLAAVESGGATIAVHCDSTCTARRLTSPTTAHGEGHFAFTMTALPASPSPKAPGPAGGGPTLSPEIVDFVGDWGISIAAVGLLGAMLAILGVQGIRRRRS